MNTTQTFYQGKLKIFYNQCAIPGIQTLIFINKTMNFFLHLAQQSIA